MGQDNTLPINEILSEQLLILDGAMGTSIQTYNLSEKDYRGAQFEQHPLDQKGNNDLLNLTQAQIIVDIHQSFLTAGAHIISTNTFNANRISMQDYGVSERAYELNRQGALLARKAIDMMPGESSPRWVAGSIGPTNKTLSLSPYVEEPQRRDIEFDKLYEAYCEQVKGLLDGGVDLFLIETIFDTLNAKAALLAVDTVLRAQNVKRPVMLSVTINDKSGRTLSGQTLEAFITSLKSPYLLSLGLNCSFGAKDLIPFVKEITSKISCFVSLHPNAGLPNELGMYDETPELMVENLKELMDGKYLNIVGGCCGTRPEHIKAIADYAKGRPPRPLPAPERKTELCGLELLEITGNFIQVGERTNVSGSRKFARLIREKKYEEALSVAKKQIENGAQIIDINLDDGLLDAAYEMKNFLRYLASDPEVARVPIMIDSSKWDVLKTGLENAQGKCIVNSISLKEGEEKFLEQASFIKKIGAAVVVMAFDEEGQATSYEKKIAVCERAYHLLVERIQFPPEDIVFDPNILTIATGLPENNNYGVDFIKATRWIKENLPYAKVSGGVSNVSFAFRGNNEIREAVNSVFLYHAIGAGLDLGIVNSEMLQIYDEISPKLLQLVEDVVLNKHEKATERLVAYAETVNPLKVESVKQKEADWRKEPVKDRVVHALIKGIADYVEVDVAEAVLESGSTQAVIDHYLMEGMNVVGERFGAGKMFLSQVIKSARVMKKSIAYLQPIIAQENAAYKNLPKRGKIVLATVKGDVHDIGKNIVKVVLECQSFEVIDLGIMVPAANIIEVAQKEKADAIGLSGLITPSLDEMCYLASELERLNQKLPLVIGGATTSKLHTVLKISPLYPNKVVYVRDASQSVGIFKNLCEKKEQERFLLQVAEDYEVLRKAHESRQKRASIPLALAREKRVRIDYQKEVPIKPQFLGTKVLKDYDVRRLFDYIDWSYFFKAWEMKGKYPELLEKSKPAADLFADAQKYLKLFVEEGLIKAKGVFAISSAHSEGDDIVVKEQGKERCFCMIRQQEETLSHSCLADYIAPKETGVEDFLGGFVVSIHTDFETLKKRYPEDDYLQILAQTLSDSLADAFAEELHLRVRKEFWGTSPEENLSMEDLFRCKYKGIRPAFGYPSLPNHEDKRLLFDWLEAEKNLGISLTESYMITPSSSVAGLYFGHPRTRYFSVGKIDKDQVKDYALRKKQPLEDVEKSLAPHLAYR